VRVRVRVKRHACARASDSGGASARHRAAARDVGGELPRGAVHRPPRGAHLVRIRVTGLGLGLVRVGVSVRVSVRVGG